MLGILEKSVSELYIMIKDIQNDMLSKQFNSNKKTMKYFTYLSAYSLLGGKRELADIVRKSGLIDRLPTEQAKINYMVNMNQYTNQGIIAMRVYRALVKSKDLTVKSIVSSLNREFIKYNKKLTYDSTTKTIRLHNTQCSIDLMNTFKDIYLFLTRLYAIECLDIYNKIDDNYFLYIIEELTGEEFC